MRVITGTARGTRLTAPAGLETRPTSEVAKEAIFSALHFELGGARVLDLFAGSGQLGIEALSRGAVHCVFVDNAKAARLAIEQNLKAARLLDQARISAMEVESFLEREKGPFDIVLLDPPYGTAKWEKLLAAVSPLVSEAGLVYCESERGEQLPETAGRLAIKKNYRYGKAMVTAYRVGRQDEKE